MNQNIKPIIFSTTMVQSILAGIKTQTRRIDKFNHSRYNVGDILWVRESCKVGAWNDQEFKMAFDYKASPELKKTPWVIYQDTESFEKIHLQTIEKLDSLGIEPIINEEKERFYYRWDPGSSPLPWKPSIHMPKEAARIFLKVIAVRRERLQDIMKSPDDCVNEGIESAEGLNGLVYKNYITGDFVCNELYSFKSLWDKINGERSWEHNPFVWVYDFKKIDKPENFLS